MDIVPYEFKKVPANPTMGFPIEAYWVNIHCFFDGSKIHYFAHQSDMLENSCMAREFGCHVHCFIMKLYVDDKHFPDIFQEIHDYVHRPYIDR